MDGGYFNYLKQSRQSGYTVKKSGHVEMCWKDCICI